MGRFPQPIDRGGSGGIYDRDAVLKALGLGGTQSQGAFAADHDPRDFEPGAIEEHLARKRAEAANSRSVARMIAKSKIPIPRKPKWDKSLTIERQLGKYVVVKKRKDGRCAIYFQVPKRLRPKGWRPTINLPLQEPRTGNLKDNGEMTRVQRDALALHQSLKREWSAQLRSGMVTQHNGKEPDA